MALNLDSIGKKIGPVTKKYDWKDVVLYALGELAPDSMT